LAIFAAIRRASCGSKMLFDKFFRGLIGFSNFLRIAVANIAKLRELVRKDYEAQARRLGL